MRLSRQLYYGRTLDVNKNNIQKTWDILNGVIKQGSTKKVYPDYFDDINGDKHNMSNIVNVFNSFFL